jgi:hypothetical protein
MGQTWIRGGSACWPVALLLIASTIAGGPAITGAATLYDDFNDPNLLIRTDLWRSMDNYSTGGVGSGRLEAIRAIDGLLASPLLAANPSNPKLVIAKRFVLQPGASSGADSDGVLLLQAGSATGVQADVAMKICFLGAPGFVRAGVELAGFNDGTSPAAGNRTGDIFARFRIACSGATNQAQISWNVFRCTDAACSNATSLATGSFGTVNVDQEYTLHVAKSGASFVFTALSQTQTFPVPGNPAAPPHLPFADVFTRVDPNTPSLGGQWAVVATFDNVMVDP